MPAEEVQNLLMEAVCIEDDDDAAIAGINAALAAGADFTSNRVTPLWRATLRRTTRVLEHLFARGATLQGERCKGNTDSPLHEVASAGRIDMLTVLLANGGRELINTADNCGLYGSPLAWAAHDGRVEVARLLLNHGALIDWLDDARIDDTPLAQAIKQGRLEMAKYLLSRGANPDVPGWMHITPRMRAKDAGPEFVRLFEGK